MNLYMDIGHGKTVIFDPKQNEFVCIVGHGSESFAAFLNGVFLQQQKNNAAFITAAVTTAQITR